MLNPVVIVPAGIPDPAPHRALEHPAALTLSTCAVPKARKTTTDLTWPPAIFWKVQPEKAYQWELRLQSPEELGADFRLDEVGSDAYRADFEAHQPDKVRELREAEQRRRERKSGGAPESDQGELEFDDEEPGEE
ncbi:hypothetical protein IV102_15865 [bacterium]|nr:hypothetical protein [bacterium]